MHCKTYMRSAYRQPDHICIECFLQINISVKMTFRETIYFWDDTDVTLNHSHINNGTYHVYPAFNNALSLMTHSANKVGYYIFSNRFAYEF